MLLLIYTAGLRKVPNQTVFENLPKSRSRERSLLRAPPDTTDKCTRARKARARKFGSLLCSYGEMCFLFCCSFAKSAKSHGFENLRGAHSREHVHFARAADTRDIYTRAPNVQVRQFGPLLCSYRKMCFLFYGSFANSAKSNGF